MDIDSLIELLESFRDELGGETEIRLATQQGYPLQARVYGLAPAAEGEGPLYIVEGDSQGYAPRGLWSEATLG